ncbi:MAG: hypothetical protein WDW36_004348 [Sanguina aurantia]
MALPDAKAVARQALLSAGTLATAFCLTMSAQAIELPFSSQAPSEKASSTANDIKSRVSTSTDSAAEQMKYSANDPASKVQNAASFPGDTPSKSTTIGSAPFSANAEPSSLGDIGKGLRSSAKQAAENVKSAVKDAATDVKNVASQPPAARLAYTIARVDDVVPGFSDVTTAAPGRGTDKTGNQISKATDDVVSSIKSAVSGNPVGEAVSRVKDASRSAGSVAEDAGRDLKSSVNRAAEKVKGAVKSTDVAMATDEVKAAAAGAASDAKNVVEKAASSSEGVVGKLNSAVFGKRAGEAASLAKNVSTPAPAGNAAAQYQADVKRNDKKVGVPEETPDLSLGAVVGEVESQVKGAADALNPST